MVGNEYSLYGIVTLSEQFRIIFCMLKKYLGRPMMYDLTLKAGNDIYDRYRIVFVI